jgi:hypothetical protein
MAFSGPELTGSRNAASAILEELGLDAYLFAVEPREGSWELTLECAVEEGWQTIKMPVDIHELLASRTDAGALSRLTASWGAKLAECRKKVRHPNA